MKLKRRSFMQALLALPLVSRLKAAQPIPEDVALNGTVWEVPWPVCRTYIVLWLDCKGEQTTYCLLCQPYKADSHEGTATMVPHLDETTAGGRYSGIYSDAELRKKLSKWERLPDMELRLWDRSKEQCVWI